MNKSANGRITAARFPGTMIASANKQQIFIISKIESILAILT